MTYDYSFSAFPNPQHPRMSSTDAIFLLFNLLKIRVVIDFTEKDFNQRFCNTFNENRTSTMIHSFPSSMLEEIERFLSSDNLRPVGQDLYEEVFETGYFFPLQRRHELAKMMSIARRFNPKVVMEIGSDKGGGLYHWCKCLPTVSKVIACEIRGTPYASLFEKAFPHDFLWLPKSSYARGTVEEVSKFLDTDTLERDTIDCLFIDGDKNNFKLDFDTYLPFMADTSVVFMHDINGIQPCQADYESIISRGYKGEKIIDLTDGLIGARESEQRIVPINSYHQFMQHWKTESMGVGVIYINKGKH